MSWTRNFGLWNLYKSELDEGDIESGPLVPVLCLVDHLIYTESIHLSNGGHWRVFADVFSPFLPSFS